MKGNKQKQFASIGASSILMIFVLLCIAIFGLLSFVTAYSDSRLTNKAKNSAERFYAAEAEGNLVLSKVDSVLAKLQNEYIENERNGFFTDINDYKLAISEMVADIEYVDLRNDSEYEYLQLLDGEMLIHIKIPIEHLDSQSAEPAATPTGSEAPPAQTPPSAGEIEDETSHCLHIVIRTLHPSQNKRYDLVSWKNKVDIISGQPTHPGFWIPD